MIIPIRCMTCNKVIANKYKLYIRLVREEIQGSEENIIDNVDNDQFDVNTPQKLIFDRLNITRYCCKRHFISQVNLIDKI